MRTDSREEKKGIRYLPASGLATMVCGGGEVGDGLLAGRGLLAQDLDTTVLVGDDTDGLLVDETGILAGVQVLQVKRVARETDTTTGPAGDNVGVVVAYMSKKLLIFRDSFGSTINSHTRRATREKLTDDLPDQIRRNLVADGGHCE